jgi:hypothetical protein
MEPLEQRELGVLASHREQAYSVIDLAGLACFAITWLDERHLPTTFENITVALFRMFPMKFCLEGYPEYPDAARVGRTLLQLGPKYRNWARGSIQRGFHLTNSGETKSDLVKEMLGSSANVATNPARRTRTLGRTMDLMKEIESLEVSTLFAKWRQGSIGATDAFDLVNMLGGYTYTAARALRKRMDYLESTAKQVGRTDIVEFLGSVRKKFSEELSDTGKNSRS